MRTLLIVDDEKNIRCGLKAMIERQYRERYAVSLAADGAEALAFLEERPVDILITDIRMPRMDGLTLIRHAAELSPRTAVIILSGHDDFGYAKEAIRFDVREYLLKPIVREEMYGILDRVEEELNRAEDAESRLGEADRVREALRTAQLNYIFVHPAVEPAEAAERCRSAGLHSLEPAFRVGALKFAGDGRQNVLAQEYLARSREGRASFHLEDQDGYLIILTGEAELFDRLMLYLKEKSVSSAYHIGLSRRKERLEEIRAGYAEARRAAGYSLLQPRCGSSLIRYESVMDREDVLEVPVDDIRRLANMLGTDREPEMKAILLRLFDLKKTSEVSLDYLERLSKLLNEMVFDDVFRTYGEESLEILRLYKRVGSIYRFSDIHEYFHQAENLLFRLNDYVRTVRSALADNREMKKAVAYIEEHYAEDLNMATVSNHVSLNYSYFSELFKEFTGQSFISYVKAVRIAKAKELLARTDEKIYEIGQKVGFENAKQFNRVFRELEGVPASEYRARRLAAGHPAR
ncbi:response regulator [Cohnella sp. JJ-181]|uniref:response regulator n=1 Tax=Cohnella rhizoplanae TaxID=2974897 RepID=UPI0022FF80E3|nr:response regulator [Cohnella sp. JJ-181]CAI6044127.1 Regulator of RpoS [Cohnella sp. JJ-181]